MSNLKDLENKLKRQAESLVKESDNLVRTVAVKVGQTVVMATPVDTGRARSNWNATIGAADTSYTTDETDFSAALTRNESSISLYKGERDKAIVISNNLPYIGALNDGSSSQAPSGFVQTAVEIGSRHIQGSRVIK